MRRAAIEALANFPVRSAIIALACASLAAAVSPRASAQEAIPTAVGAPGDGAPPTPEAEPFFRLSDHTDQGPDVLRPVGPCGAPAKPDGTPDRSPHGEVWAGVGTGGYRDIGGAVCTPIGDYGALSVAVDAGRANGWTRPR